MRIIHIASFKGNAGDIFNHNGFYSLLFDMFGSFEITKAEIRDFYFNAKKQRKFDRSFAETVNEYDLCVLGGGSFFDCQWSDSPTGTTMSITDEFIECVRTPVLINAMGYHEFPGRTNEVCVTGFERFLTKVCNRKNWFVAIRNDGSAARLRNRYPNVVMSQIFFTLDNAFYNRIDDIERKKQRIIGLCITNEAFSKEFNGKAMTCERFNGLMINIIETLSDMGWRIMFFAHTPQDVDVLSHIMGKLSEWVRRNRLLVSPCDFIGDEGEVTSLYYEWYSKCGAIISMRFHGCVMGFLTGVPTMALAGHEQLLGLYDELGMRDLALKVEEGFDKRIFSALDLTVDSYQKCRKSYIEHVTETRERYKESVLDFVRKCRTF